LRRLAAATTRPTALDDREPESVALVGNETAPAGPVAAFVGYLRDNGLRLPSATDTTVERGRVDLVYREDHCVVILDYRHGDPDITPLVFGGWNVITVNSDEPFDAVVAMHPSVFGVAS